MLWKFYFYHWKSALEIETVILFTFATLSFYTFSHNYCTLFIFVWISNETHNRRGIFSMCTELAALIHMFYDKTVSDSMLYNLRVLKCVY